jgi:hypothetical protein
LQLSNMKKIILIKKHIKGVKYVFDDRAFSIL